MPPMSDLTTGNLTNRLLTNRFSSRLISLLVLGVILFSVMGCAAVVPASSSSATSWQGLWKIGVALPFSGYDAESASNVFQAIRLVVHDVNEHGGIDGHRLELLSLDDGSTPEQSSQQARLLAADPAVLGVVGHLQSDTALAAAEQYRQAGVPFLALRASASALTASEPAFVFRMGASDQDIAVKSANAMHDAGIKRLFILSDNSPGHRSQADVVATCASQTGITVVANVGIDPAQRDFAALIEQVRSARSEAVFFAGSFQQAALVVGALEQAKVTRIVLLGDEADCTGFKRLVSRPALDLRYVSSVGPDLAAADYDQAYQKATGMAPTAIARSARDATSLLLTAVQKAAKNNSQPTRERVLTELRGGEEFSGITGAVRFDSFGNRIGTIARVSAVAWEPSNIPDSSFVAFSRSGNQYAR
jgi:branched-chain amino acid transport system substrate-binding protein